MPKRRIRLPRRMVRPMVAKHRPLPRRKPKPPPPVATKPKPKPASPAAAKPAAAAPSWRRPPVLQSSVCVVGNGPSALGQGQFIDSHDFVVRCTSWVTAHRGESGSKINAWAWFGSPSLWPRLYKIPEGSFESWFVLVRSGKKFNSIAMDYAHKVALERGWKTHDILPELFSDVKATLKIQPSTGFLAVLMALTRLNPIKMTVIGMDCTLPTNPGWDEPYPVVPWKTDGKKAFGHNFCLEKVLLEKLIREKRFGRFSWDSEVVWRKACPAG